MEGGVAGTFSSTTGLTINASTGKIDLSESTPGTYTVTNTVAAAGGCGQVVSTSPVTINALPSADFTYSANAFCTSGGTNPSPSGVGVGAGVFTSVPAGIQFVNSSSGEINLTTSTPGTYRILNTVEANGGCSDVISTFDNLVITTLPSTPSIVYSGSPYCTSLNTAQSVELTGISGGTYTASPEGLAINASTGAITPSSSTPGTYTVTYTIAAGGGCTAVSTTAEVTINQTPSVTNVDTYQICSGTNTNIVLTSSIPSTFRWTLGEVSSDVPDATAGTGSAISQVLNNFNNSTPGNVQYLVIATSTENSCASSPYTITATVNPNPVLIINQPEPVCSPSTVDITAGAITSGSSTGLTLTYWTDFSASVSLANANAVNTTGIYYIKGTSASGCSSVRDVNVTINALPSATISGSTSVCQDAEEPVITFTGSNATAPYTFTYNINGGSDETISTVSGNSVTVPVPTSVAGTFTYSLSSVHDASSTACSQSATGNATVIVNPTLTASVSITASANPSCTGNSVTYTATPVHQGSSPVYQWKVNNVDAGTNSSTFSYVPSDGDVVSLVMTSNETPCLEGSPATSNSVTMTVQSCKPDVTTQAANSISANGATLNGNIVSAGGSSLTAKGFKYSTVSGFDPLSSGTSVSGNGALVTGSYTAVVSGLLPSTTYYVRSYATNNAGTTYGSEVSFTTLIQTDFGYTGSAQTFIVPAGVTSVIIEAWGAQGGGSYGGNGGYASGTLSVTPGQALAIYVGGQGGTNAAAGWNGGGLGGYDLQNGGATSGGGGGASDVRAGGVSVIIAGGGGGACIEGGENAPGGTGGGMSGSNAPNCINAIGGAGGTQSGPGIVFTTSRGATSGSGSQGGNGSSAVQAWAGGGGGGGYFGGAGGTSTQDHPAGYGAGGGGGSSYIGGVSGGTTQSGQRSGNGYVRISF